MKKILLSSIACLLALGLVTACNNEEEDVSGSDGDTQESGDTTQGGGTTEGGGTTQGGGTTEAVTLTNYTLSFAFVDEARDPVEIPSWGAISIKGGWDNWAEWITLTPEDDGTYTCTFTSIKAGTYEYKGTLWYADKEDTGWLIPVVTDPDGHDGNCTLTVVGTEGDDYLAPTETFVITEEQLALLPEPEPATTLTDYVVTFKFYKGGELTSLGEDVNLLLQGSWDSWASWLTCTASEETGIYTYTFVSIETGTYQYKGVTCATNETPTDPEDWSNVATVISGSGPNGNEYLIVSSEDDGGQTVEVEIVEPGVGYGSAEAGQGLTINIVTINTAQSAVAQTLYLTGGISTGDYWNTHYTMADIGDTEFADNDKVGNVFTYYNWSSSDELTFCIHAVEGDGYYHSAILFETDISGDSNDYKFWSSYTGATDGSYMGISVPWISNISNYTSITLTLSFDYTELSEDANVKSSAMTYTCALA